jgi:hypothetical protein
MKYKALLITAFGEKFNQNNENKPIFPDKRSLDSKNTGNFAKIKGDTGIMNCYT